MLIDKKVQRQQKEKKYRQRQLRQQKVFFTEDLIKASPQFTFKKVYKNFSRNTQIPCIEKVYPV